jgi:hypothetical protein
MTYALRLTLERDNDGTCRLDCQADYDGFAGRGEAWFNAAEIEGFCDTLELYPLPASGVVLTGGYGGSAGERVVTTELRVQPTDSVGGLDLVATLAEFPVHHRSSEVLRSAIVRMPVSYEELRTLATRLRALLRGTASQAVLEATYQA